MIAHITPFCTGNIGKGINDMISLLPDDAWICLRDQDTLLFEALMIFPLVLHVQHVLYSLGMFVDNHSNLSLIIFVK